jgi:phage internal scaffolding protein
MSYHEMQNVIADANSAFASLPATVRARFENDPAKYIEFVSDENNLEEARELGMLSPEAVERLDKAEADRAAAEAGRAQGGGTPSGQAPQDPASTQ